MMIREPAVAGLFYPADADTCLQSVKACLAQGATRSAARAGGAGCEAATAPPAGGRLIGGVVPHAGWACSGAVAARVIERIAAGEPPETVIVFGAIHVPHGPRATIFPRGAWQTPLGLAHIDERLSERVAGQTGLLDLDPHAHDGEHSIEVEVPFIQHLLPAARIVPIMVPPHDRAATLGTTVGNVCRAYGARVVFLASTDLTHYGPNYRFTPHGVGEDGLRWARDVNDRRMIDLILALHDDQAVPEALTHHNACGPGAIAATIAACRAYGATAAELLDHTTSHEVLGAIRPEPPRDAVGYAGIVFTG